MSAELTGRRLAVALVAFALLPGGLAVAAAAYEPPPATPGPPAYDPLPLPQTPELSALQAREMQRSRRATREAAALAAPTLTGPAFPDRVPTLVLAPRPAPYRLGELRALQPAAFSATPDGGLLVRAALEVPRGAALVLDAAETPDVRLASSPAGFASLIARGDVDIVGTAAQPLRLSSWDEAAGARDTEVADGRSFVLALGSRLDVTHADIGHLGFGTGNTSGIAWRGEPAAEGAPEVPARGEVSHSRLHHNWFGAYTFEARDMRWSHNVFADNHAYGFDPHDLSNGFVVEHNVASGNGRHGFIFSRGCDGNVLRDNVAYGNRGHGFMIDDGRTGDTEGARARPLTSDDNLLERNHAYDNDGSGIEIEGGSGNVVRDNLLERNHVGVRLKNGASAEVSGNEITDSRLFGVDVFSTAGAVSVHDNTVRGGWGGIAVGAPGRADLARNTLEAAATPLVVAGESVRDDSPVTVLARLYSWNPLLVLWTAILGTPLLVVVVRAARRALRHAGLASRRAVV